MKKLRKCDSCGKKFELNELLPFSFLYVCSDCFDKLLKKKIDKKTKNGGSKTHPFPKSKPIINSGLGKEWVLMV